MLLARPFFIFDLYEYLGASVKQGGTRVEVEERMKFAGATLDAATTMVCLTTGTSLLLSPSISATTLQTGRCLTRQLKLGTPPIGLRRLLTPLFPCLQANTVHTVIEAGYMPSKMPLIMYVFRFLPVCRVALLIFSQFMDFHRLTRAKCRHTGTRRTVLRRKLQEVYCILGTFCHQGCSCSAVLRYS